MEIFGIISRLDKNLLAFEPTLRTIAHYVLPFLAKRAASSTPPPRGGDALNRISTKHTTPENQKPARAVVRVLQVLHSTLMNPSTLTTAEGYYKQFAGDTFVIKLGGKPIDNPDVCRSILESIAQFRKHGIACVFVHGGGVQVDDILGSADRHPESQLRITPKHAVARIEEARSALSARIAAMCSEVGLQAEILDPGVAEAERIPFHGETGRIKHVDKRQITAALHRGSMPILPFGGRDHEGEYLNVNADHNAAEVAVELDAKKLIMLTGTDGVMLPSRNGNGARKISFMDRDQLMRLLRKQTPNGGGVPKFVIDEGMYPKLDAAEVAIGSRRVEAVHILKADGPALLDEVLTRTGSGTMIERFQSVLIDTATEADVESIEALLQEAQKFTTPKGTSYLKPRTRTEITNDLPGTLVFKHQGVPVGTICYTSLPREQHTAVIRSFAVAENHQSSQYGRVLLEACLDRIRKHGFQKAVSITAAEQLKHLYMHYGATKDEGAYADVLAPSLGRYDQSERDLLHLYVFDMTAEQSNNG